MGRRQRDVMLATRPYSAPTPEGLGQGTERTWVDDALLPLGVSNDLVLIHHLDVLVLHVATAEGSGRHQAPLPCHSGQGCRGCGRLTHLMVVCFSWW